MDDAVRIGIVGCGKISTVGHAPELSRCPGAKIVALCDLVESKAKALRDQFAPDASLFTDFDQFLKFDLDAVTIATPNYLHCPMTLAALGSGRHVLCEKPMAGSVADARKMVAAARKARRVLHINQSLRYTPVYATVAGLVHSGQIGTPLHIRCIRAHNGTPDKAWSPGASWFVSKAAQGGIIFDIGVHMAEFMQWCVGPVSSISSFLETRTPGIDVPDHAAAVFRFENGASGVLELSWTMPFGAGMLEVYGSAGCIRMGFSEKPIELTTLQNGAYVKTYPDLLTDLPGADHEFIEAVRGRCKTRTPGEVGLEAVALCEAIAKAGEAGKRIKVFRAPKAAARKVKA